LVGEVAERALQGQGFGGERAGGLDGVNVWGSWLARGDAPGIIRAMTGIDCIAALKALGELSRLRIVRLLLKERLGVNAISERLGMTQYNVSKHLRILKEAGLVEMEKQGQQRLYTIVPSLKSQLAASRNVLELGCCTFRFDKLPK
jgi:DNA-binding transcriptional ArsR family regulator